MEEEIEVWKGIPGYEELYQVSSFGRIKSLDRVFSGNMKNQFREYNSSKLYKGKILAKNKERKTKYLTISLYSDGTRLDQYVHRLTAQLFVPNPDNLPEVNHDDGNKKNNYHGNLKWTTEKGNAEHAAKIGLYIVGNKHHNYGRPFAENKIVINTESGIFYDSIGSAAKTTSFSKSHFRKMVHDIHPNKTSFILC